MLLPFPTFLWVRKPVAANFLGAAPLACPAVSLTSVLSESDPPHLSLCRSLQETLKHCGTRALRSPEAPPWVSSSRLWALALCCCNRTLLPKHPRSHAG